MGDHHGCGRDLRRRRRDQGRSSSGYAMEGHQRAGGKRIGSRLVGCASRATLWASRIEEMLFHGTVRAIAYIGLIQYMMYSELLIDI